MRYLLASLLFAVPLFAQTTPPSLVVITPPHVLLSPGQTQQMHAYAYYQNGTVTDVTNSGSTWSTLNASIATVSTTGLVTMKSAGSALIQSKVAFVPGYGTVWNKFTPFVSVPPGNASFGKIKHIVYIIKENRSFDHYFGTFPRANGATTGKLSTGQVITLGHTPGPILP